MKLACTHALIGAVVSLGLGVLVRIPSRPLSLGSGLSLLISVRSSTPRSTTFRPTHRRMGSASISARLCSRPPR